MHARVDLRKSKFRAGGHGRQSARLSRRPVGPIRCAMSSPPDGWPGGRGLVALVSEIEGKGEGAQEVWAGLRKMAAREEERFGPTA